MTVSLSQLKKRVETDLDDATLSLIIDAETEAVNRYAGGLSETQTELASGSRKIVLHRKPASIDSIKERRTLDDAEVTLANSDWRQIGDRILYRLGDGTNPEASWGAEVVIDYTPAVDQKMRDRVVLDLCQLSIEFRAFESETVGDWEGDQAKYQQRRDDLLGQIREPRALLI